jgi:cardiolipin synthase A/B
MKAKKKKSRLHHDERIVLDPSERLDAILQLIRAARKQLLISLFRCNEVAILKELAGALRRKVKVHALVTPRAKGGKKRLEELGFLLENMGAEVHRYPDQVVKYHAKYLLADDGPAIVASLNFTKKCFRRTSDFLQITNDPEVISGLTRLFESDCHGLQSILPRDFSDRLIVGPDRARAQISELLQQARRSISIVDKKVTDSEMLTLLEAKKAEGVEVRVLGNRSFGDLVSHGKLMLVDDSTAVIGSISLSTLSLEFRRELAMKIQDPRCVRQLVRYFKSLAACAASERAELLEADLPANDRGDSDDREEEEG